MRCADLGANARLAFRNHREEKADGVDAFLQQALGEFCASGASYSITGLIGCTPGLTSKPAAVMRARKYVVFSTSCVRSSPAASSISKALMPAATTCGGNELENK